MARNQQTFKTVVKMEASQFKKEARNISRMVGQMRNAFMGFAASLGAGLGLGSLLSTMRKTSVELSTAMATLENVSTQTKKYIVDNQEATIATSNFAKTFGFVKRLADEYKQDLIALTYGYAQFKAASDQANVSMEDQELIYEALTRAAAFFHMSGDRTRDMMNAVIQMMSKGKVASEELRRQLGNSLPGAFGIMAVAAQKAGLSVSGTVSELEELMRNGEIISAKVLPEFARELNKITANINLDSLQLSINELKNAWTNLTKDVNMQGFYDKIVKATTSAIDFIRKNLNGLKADAIAVFAAIGSYKLFKPLMDQGERWVADQQRLLKQYEKDYKKTLDRLMTYERQSGNSVQFDFPSAKNGGKGQMKLAPNAMSLPSKQEQDAMLKTLGQANVQFTKFANQQKIVGKGFSRMGILAKGLGVTIKGIGATIASMGLVALFSALLGVVTNLVTRFIEWRKELKEIAAGTKDFVDDNRSNADAITKQKIQMQYLLKELKAAEGNEKKREKIIRNINDLMSGVAGFSVTTKDSFETIANKGKDWYDTLVKLSRVQSLIEEKAENENRMAEYRKQITEKEAEVRKHMPNNGNNAIKEYNGPAKLKAEYQALVEGYNTLVKRNKELDEEIKKLGVVQDITEDTENENKGGNKTFEDRLKALNKVLDDYKEKMDGLASQYKRGAITNEEYDNAVNKLNIDTWKEIAAFKELDVLLKHIAGGYKLVANIQQGAEFAKIWEEVDELVKQYIKDVDKAIEAEDKALEKLNEKRGEFAGYSRPSAPSARPTTFDYKKDTSEIYREEIERLNDYKEKVQEAISQVKGWVRDGVEGSQTELDSLFAILSNIIKRTNELETKADLAEIYADYKDAAKDAFEGTAEGIENLISVFERLTNAVIQYKEAHGESLTKSEREEWERITSTIGLFVTVLESVTSLYKTINTLTEIWTALEKVKEGQQKKNIQLAATETAAEGAKTSAKAAGAVAGATEAGSSIPFPYNLLAIAAGVAAVIGALAMMSKFENGGFVKGKGNHGDHNVVRANHGELILNPAQQRNLLALANGTSGIGGGEVQFKIRGADLVGVLNNESNRRKG